MPLNVTKCETCEGNIIYDQEKQIWCCDSCGRTYMYEKPQEIYNKNIINVANAKFGESIEERLKAAETYLAKHHDYDKAKEMYHAIADKNPDSWQAWWGKVRAISHEFTKYDLEPDEDGNSSILGEMVENMNKILNVVEDEGDYSEICDKWNSYIQEIFAEYQTIYDKCSEAEGKLESDIERHEREEAELEDRHQRAEKQLKDQQLLCDNLTKELTHLKTKVLSKTELISGWTIWSGVLVLWIYSFIRLLSTQQIAYLGMGLLYLLAWIVDCIIWGILMIIYFVRKSSCRKKTEQLNQEQNKISIYEQAEQIACSKDNEMLETLIAKRDTLISSYKKSIVIGRFLANHDIDDLLLE